MRKKLLLAEKPLNSETAQSIENILLNSYRFLNSAVGGHFPKTLDAVQKTLRTMLFYLCVTLPKGSGQVVYPPCNSVIQIVIQRDPIYPERIPEQPKKAAEFLGNLITLKEFNRFNN